MKKLKMKTVQLSLGKFFKGHFLYLICPPHPRFISSTPLELRNKKLTNKVLKSFCLKKMDEQLNHRKVCVEKS